MQTLTRLGTFAEVFSIAPLEIARIDQALRHLIEQLHPENLYPRPGPIWTNYDSCGSYHHGKPLCPKPMGDKN